MSADRDADRIVRSWLREDGHERADRVLGEVLASVTTIPQRRSSWPARRFSTMNNLARLAAGLAAVSVIVVAGAAVLPNLGLVGRPTGTPSPTPSPSATSHVGSILEAGTYTTADFRPSITYTVPAGWTLISDGATEFAIAPAAFPNSTLTICRDPIPGDRDAYPVPSVGPDAEALSSWFAGRPEVGVMSGPTPWSLGGLEGFWFDLRGPSDEGEVALFGVRGGNRCGINNYPDQRIRLGLLDGPDGVLMAYILDFLGGEGYIEAATTVIETFVFDVP